VVIGTFLPPVDARLVESGGNAVEHVQAVEHRLGLAAVHGHGPVAELGQSAADRHPGVVDQLQAVQRAHLLVNNLNHSAVVVFVQIHQRRRLLLGQFVEFVVQLVDHLSHQDLGWDGEFTDWWHRRVDALAHVVLGREFFLQRRAQLPIDHVVQIQMLESLRDFTGKIF
jgi:hypothetical protein